MLLSFSPHSTFLTQFNEGSYMAAVNIRCFNRHISISSQPLRPVPLPRPMEAHMWYVIPDEIKGTSLLEQYLEILSPSEKQTVLSLKDDELRKRAILARTLVRTTIARYQTNPTIDPRSLSFKKNSYGKPEVDRQFASGYSPPPLHFNLSHTSSLVACGITSHSPIGIDVEEKKRIVKNDVMSFARRFFCRHEVEHLANISDPVKRRQEFMKLWTLKESYVKALGRGFSATPFNTFRISCKASFISVSDVPYIASSKVPKIVVQCVLLGAFLASCPCNWNLADNNGYLKLLNQHTLPTSGSLPSWSWLILIMLLFASRRIQALKKLKNLQ